MTPALRVRIPPPKQAAAAAPAPETVQSGNGAAAVAPTQKLTAAAPPVDPELEDDPVKPLPTSWTMRSSFEDGKSRAADLCWPAAQQPRSRSRVRSNGRGADGE